MGEGPKRKDSRGMLANGSGRVRAAIEMVLTGRWILSVRYLWCKSVDVMEQDEEDEDDAVFDGSSDGSIYTIETWQSIIPYPRLSLSQITDLG